MAGTTKTSGGDGGKRSPLRKLIGLIALGLALAALAKELKQPAAERTWNGKVLDVVPYDFRKPSMDRVRAVMWNPEGPLISPRVFGVGWTINFGAAIARLRRNGSAADRSTVGVTS